MVFVIERGRTKVNQIDLRRKQHASKFRAPSGKRARGGYISIVGEGLICVVKQQDVLGLEIRMNEVKIVQECYRAK